MMWDAQAPFDKFRAGRAAVQTGRQNTEFKFGSVLASLELSEKL